MNDTIYWINLEVFPILKHFKYVPTTLSLFEKFWRQIVVLKLFWISVGFSIVFGCEMEVETFVLVTNLEMIGDVSFVEN